MAGKEILQKIKLFGGGKGKGKKKSTSEGSHMVKGKSNHAMEDCLVSEFRQEEDIELGLFAIYDGHSGHDVANYLKTHLFAAILKEPGFWSDPESAVKRAYAKMDHDILHNSRTLGRGGSTAVTAVLINDRELVVANVGDSRAVVCENGVARQITVDHEPSSEKRLIESRGGFVSNLPGDVPRVDGQLAVARAFGDKSLKVHLSSEPDVSIVIVEEDTTEFMVLASDGVWKVMTNQEAVDSIRHIKDPHSAAKHLIAEAVSRRSKDDISCIVVRF